MLLLEFEEYDVGVVVVVVVVSEKLPVSGGSWGSRAAVEVVHVEEEQVDNQDCTLMPAAERERERE